MKNIYCVSTKQHGNMKSCNKGIYIIDKEY